MVRVRCNTPDWSGQIAAQATGHTTTTRAGGREHVAPLSLQAVGNERAWLDQNRSAR